MRISDWSSDVCSSDLSASTSKKSRERPTTASPHFNSSSAESALPPAATRTFFLPLRFARCAVGIIRWCLLWCTGIGLRPEFWLRLRFRLGPGFRLRFRAGFGCRRFGCAFRNRLFSSYLDLFPPRALGLFHDGFSFSRACRRLDLRFQIGRASWRER